jgi:HPt (histidine-containing phosphotransfer) domain-containing protein
VAAVFRGDLAQRQSQLLAALQQAQWAQLREVAHLLKGAALSAGAADLARCADALEHACQAQPLEEATCTQHAQALLAAMEQHLEAPL